MHASCSTSSHVESVPVGWGSRASLHVRPRPPLARQHTLGRQQRHTCAAAAGGAGRDWLPEEDPYFKLLGSKLMQNEMVKQEHTMLVNELQTLSVMAHKFPEFDVDGKRMFLDKLNDSTERYQIFIKRLELSDAPEAKEYLRHTNAQMLEGGFSLHMMLQGLTQSLATFRNILEEEERCVIDPMRHAAFKERVRAEWAKSSLGRFDLGKLARTASPEKLFKAQNHPEFFKALKEITSNPSPEVLSRWLGHEEIGPFVADLWKSMQGNGGPASFGGL